MATPNETVRPSKMLRAIRRWVTPTKPQGRKGPVTVGAAGVQWKVIKFPREKGVREQMIADMFVRAANFLRSDT